ncbi:MAG TPA: thermonuclease family protein [Synergistales bacterium]|nr:thermonuclease family protein [Synergistales bacterium]
MPGPKRPFILLFLLLLLTLPGNSAGPLLPLGTAWGETILGTVTTVFDGDTVEVLLDTGRIEKVRYLMIDAPELHHPKREVEEFGLEAALANRDLVLGKRVRLETDVQPRDRFGRLLAFVWIDRPNGSILVNEKLVEEGFALPFTLPPNVRFAGRIRSALYRARNGGKGFWGTAAGRLFTPKQVWADLPLLAGSFITLEMRVDGMTRFKTGWRLFEQGTRTALVLYDEPPGLFGSIGELKGARVRVLGKVQASYRGAEIPISDPLQILSVFHPARP